MSMISTQCDELRKTADELQDVLDNGHNYTWSGFYSTLRYAQQELRSAADTIWELRCKLAGVVDQSEEIDRLKEENARLRRASERDADVMESLNLSLEEAQAENANLREELEAVGTAGYLYGKKQLEEENAKLRELIYDIIVDEERGHNDDRTFSEHVSRAHEYGIAQDIEV